MEICKPRLKMAHSQYLPVIIHGGMSGLRSGVNVHDSFFLRLTLTLHPKSLRGISSKQSWYHSEPKFKISTRNEMQIFITMSWKIMNTFFDNTNFWTNYQFTWLSICQLHTPPFQNRFQNSSKPGPFLATINIIISDESELSWLE